MEDLTIAELFDQAYQSYEQIQSNKIDATANIYKDILQRLKIAEEKLDELHLFSDNEDLTEVATNELRYFILYALMGWSYEFRPAIREQRASDVQFAMSYYVKYLELCMHYGLVRDIPKVTESDEPSKRTLTFQDDRQQKIQKLKAKKELEQSIAKLRTMNHADDEIRRQLYIEQIRWWIQQSEEEMIALNDEKKLLGFTQDQQTKSIEQSKNALPFNGPFTILPTKDRLYREAIGGSGYPSLPTMTVQEFYDDLMRQQAAQQSTQPTPTVQSTPLSDEQRNEIDDPVYRENVRRMDEFKDDNPRGSGNRYNHNRNRLIMTLSDATNFREQGNQAYRQGNFQQAIDRYTDAINILHHDQTISEATKTELTKCYSNRCQCHMNLGQYEDAIDDATRALEYTPSDQKSLYRRANAFERSGKLNEAISDAQRLMMIAPKDASKNEETNQLLRKLREIAQSKYSQQAQSITQVQQMFEMISNKSNQHETALNNLLVLSREDAGAENILAYDQDLKPFKDLFQSDDRVRLLGSLRILASVMKNSYKRAELIYKKIGLKPIARCLSMSDHEIVTNASILVNNLLMSICDLENRRKIRKPINVPFNFDPFVTELINHVFRMLADLIDDKSCPGIGRDCCLDLVVKFVDRANGCNWTGKFIITGVPKVLRVAATVPELSEPDKKQYPLTSQTKMHISCVLSVIYHDLCSDREREEFNNECLEFVKALRERDDVQSHVKTISVLAVLLQGPFDTGNAILGSQNLVDLMIHMAGSCDPIQERIAVEAIVLSASKKDKATGILSAGSEVLKDLYQSSNEDIKVLALVVSTYDSTDGQVHMDSMISFLYKGLSKLASSKGTDSSGGLVTEGSCQTLARACCKFLTTSGSFDIRRWSADGLAYLTLDADVKEELADNTSALKALFGLCQSQDANVLYSITTIFVNITNTYETRKAEKEMAELAKYAKQHVPKDHPLDGREFVEKRREKLVDAGVIPVLVQLCKHKSENCREQIARVFLGLCEFEQYRGPIIAAGGAKSLLPLTSEGTPTGKTKAAQSLAKIAITTNPENAFPGQRMLEAVRPILQLLKTDNTALENFEALMALTNLASLGESVRKRILKEGGFTNIEQYMYEDHPMLRRAATECICNMVVQEDMKKFFVGENDRMKLLVLLCGEDDEPLIKAASGTLAILSTLDVDLSEVNEIELDDDERKKLNTMLEENRILCDKMLQVKSFFEIFKHLCASPNMDIQFRAFYIIRNLVKVNKIVATQIVSSELMDVLLAIKEMKDDRVANEKNRTLVEDIVKICLDHGLIQANKDRVIEEEDENVAAD